MNVLESFARHSIPDAINFGAAKIASHISTVNSLGMRQT